MLIIFGNTLHFSQQSSDCTYVSFILIFAAHRKLCFNEHLHKPLGILTFWWEKNTPAFEPIIARGARSSWSAALLYLLYARTPSVPHVYSWLGPACSGHFSQCSRPPPPPSLSHTQTQTPSLWFWRGAAHADARTRSLLLGPTLEIPVSHLVDTTTSSTYPCPLCDNLSQCACRRQPLQKRTWACE